MINCCKVKCCRFPTTHNTSAHRCGSCGDFGHGQLECRKPIDIFNLRRFDYNIKVFCCRVPNCNSPTTHDTSAHYCNFCDMRGDCICPSSTIVTTKFEKKCPQCNTFGMVDISKFYYTGSDCSICMEPSKMVLFEACSHVNVCSECIVKL